jgi:hypothetical protein
MNRRKRTVICTRGNKIALDPDAWLAEQEARAQAIADFEANAAVDQLDSEAEAVVRQGKSKKRKRETEATPSVTTKAKSNPKMVLEPLDPQPYRGE